MAHLAPPHSSLRKALRECCPQLPAERLEGIVSAWSRELDGIIELMLEAAAAADGSALHHTLKDEVTSELARLSDWLAHTIVAKKLEGIRCDDLDPDVEWDRSGSPDAHSRIAATARVLTDSGWSRLTKDWVRRSARLLDIGPRARQRAPRQLRPRQFVVENHFIPVFSNKPWADKHGKVLVIRREVGNSVAASRTAHTKWGKARYLYSQELEHQLSAIEGDARSPFEKLLRSEPFSGLDVQDWVTFLIAQYLRTPRFILRNMSQLRQVIREHQWTFATTTKNLRAAYETLFRNSRVYTLYFRAIDGRRWWVARAPSDHAFIKPDEPVAHVRNPDRAASSFLMPLSPNQCFIAGDFIRKQGWPLKVGPLQLTATEFELIQTQLARNARHSAI